MPLGHVPGHFCSIGSISHHYNKGPTWLIYHNCGPCVVIFHQRWIERKLCRALICKSVNLTRGSGRSPTDTWPQKLEHHHISSSSSHPGKPRWVLFWQRQMSFSSEIDLAAFSQKFQRNDVLAGSHSPRLPKWQPPHFELRHNGFVRFWSAKRSAAHTSSNRSKIGVWQTFSTPQWNPLRHPLSLFNAFCERGTKLIRLSLCVNYIIFTLDLSARGGCWFCLDGSIRWK